MFALGSIFGRLTSDTGTGKTIALKLATVLGKINVKTRASRHFHYYSSDFSNHDNSLALVG